MTAESLQWRNVCGATMTNPLIVAMADDGDLRMKARGLADLLNLHARMLLKFNPASDPQAQAEARRRELGYAVINVERELRSMIAVAALHEEAFGLTELTTTPAGKGAVFSRR